MADSGMMREAWAAYEPFRDQFTSLAPDKYPPEYIDGCVMIGSWRCWGTDQAAILTEVREYPSGLKELHGLAAAGDVSAILELIEVAEAWGRQRGCAIAAIESRPAWQKLLPGYEPEQVRIVKGLN